MSLYSVNDAAGHLGVTPDEVIDAAGLTLGELELAAEQHGFCATCYRQVPVLTDSDLQKIADRLNA